MNQCKSLLKTIIQRKPLYHFITTVLAIIGGTFTVAGMIDSMVSGDKQYKIFMINVMNFEGYNDSSSSKRKF